MRFVGVHMDQIGNLAGMKFEDMLNGESLTIGDNVAFNRNHYSTQIAKSNITHLVGLRTTMDCISAKTIRSIQFIYISQDPRVCEVLVPLSPTNIEVEENIVYCSQEYL